MLFGSKQAPIPAQRIAALEASVGDVEELRREVAALREGLRHERRLAVIGIVIALVAAGGTIWQASVAQNQLAAAGSILRGSAAVIMAVDTASKFEPGRYGERAYAAGETPAGDVEVRVEVSNVGQSVATIEKVEVAWSDGNVLVGAVDCGFDRSTGLPTACPKPLKVEQGDIRVFTLPIPQPSPCVERNPRVEMTRVVLTTTDGAVLDLSTGVRATTQSLCPDDSGD